MFFVFILSNPHKQEFQETSSFSTYLNEILIYYAFIHLATHIEFLLCARRYLGTKKITFSVFMELTVWGAGE